MNKEELDSLKELALHKGWMTENAQKMNDAELYYYLVGKKECDDNGWTADEYIIDTFVKALKQAVHAKNSKGYCDYCFCTKQTQSFKNAQICKQCIAIHH